MAGLSQTATDQNGNERKFKLLNLQYLGLRRLHTDAQGVANPDSGIEKGDILTCAGGEKFLVAMVTTDYYKELAIRLAFDLIETNNTVSVFRNTPQHSPQGGLLGNVETLIHTDVPVKIGAVLQTRDKDNDTTALQFGMLLSVKYPLENGDRLKFGSFYEDAKVEGIQLNHEGMFEITFDKDPRWT
jgi:hypothetical protein